MIWLLIIGILFIIQTEYTAIGVLFIIASVFRLCNGLITQWRLKRLEEKL